MTEQEFQHIYANMFSKAVYWQRIWVALSFLVVVGALNTFLGFLIPFDLLGITTYSQFWIAYGISFLYALWRAFKLQMFISAVNRR